jgi:hypothetical protein
VRMMPLLDERVTLVRAVIETEHYSFDATTPSPGEEAGRTAAAGGQ